MQSEFVFLLQIVVLCTEIPVPEELSGEINTKKKKHSSRYQMFLTVQLVWHQIKEVRLGLIHKLHP